MGFVNKVMLLGNTTRTPELRELPSGTRLCDFGLAINRTYKTAAGEEKQETVFVDCTAFGRTAEVIAEYCPTGRALFIEGRLHYQTWEDKSGNKRNKLSVVVETFQFIGSRDAAPTETFSPVEAPQTPLGKKRTPARIENSNQTAQLAAATSDLDLPF